ncbi:MAG: hypothetical protein IJ202_14200 [Bacteroidales bacterium]|nr:hypothetical protein [Bacteroidales bacterium]MBQ9711623.1 hypothetical protein [Bacteroidales bacterium]
MTLDLDKENLGRNFTGIFGDADPIWFALTGFKADDDGRLWNIGRKSVLWTSTPDLDKSDPEALSMAFGLSLERYFDDIMVFTAEDCCRAVGFSVRCVLE